MPFATITVSSPRPDPAGFRGEGGEEALRGPSRSERKRSSRWPAASLPRSSVSGEHPGATRGDEALRPEDGPVQILLGDAEQGGDGHHRQPVGEIGEPREVGRVRSSERIGEGPRPPAARLGDPRGIERVESRGEGALEGAVAGAVVHPHEMAEELAGGRPDERPGTGSAGGRTRQRSLASTAVTAAALDATQSCRASSR